MGAIPGLVGLGGGAAGTSFQGPQGANIVNPTSPDQISGAYSGVQGGLQGQQALLAALQAQNGVGNQSQVYNQLQGIASGAVNPAQAQFAQNTAQNVGNQAALMAGQRGASSNVGLIARQADQQGAGIQQQAVGQEAAQQAQNQIAAIGAAGNLATTQAGQQIGQTNANTQAQQAEQSNLLNALQGYNTNQVASQSNVNAANAGLANTQMQGTQNIIGGIMNSGSALAKASGGDVVRMAAGGVAGPQSSFGQFIGASTNSISPSPQDPANTPMSYENRSKQAFQKQGGKSTPSGSNISMPNGSVVGPDNNFGAPQLAMPKFGAAQGGAAKDFRVGGKVNATSKKERAVKGGNSYANDKIPAVLSEHEIVLPRSVTLSKDPVGEAAKFVASVISKRKSRK